LLRSAMGLRVIHSNYPSLWRRCRRLG